MTSPTTTTMQTQQRRSGIRTPAIAFPCVVRCIRTAPITIRIRFQTTAASPPTNGMTFARFETEA